MMEEQFVDWLRARSVAHPNVLIGPGDDAAVLRWHKSSDCVVTSDLLADGVHFQLGQADPHRIGRKAAAVNLSDLAAMAAEPHSLILSLLLPRPNADELARALYRGFSEMADRFDCPIVGGDTNCWDGPLVVSATAIGKVTSCGPMTRSGARPGDAIVVTGSFGGSIVGRHLDFVPRVQESLFLNANYEVHAAIDVTDGISLDLSRVCNESQCGAVLNTSTIPLSKDLNRLVPDRSNYQKLLNHALNDGEDFELLLAMPDSVATKLVREQPLDVSITRIGTFVAEKGIWQTTDDGKLQSLPIDGYRHG